MVDEAYQDRTGWIKKSIRTTAKVRLPSFFILSIFIYSIRHFSDGQVQLGPRDHELRRRVLEHRALQGCGIINALDALFEVTLPV